jgi:hypothetical protein
MVNTATLVSSFFDPQLEGAQAAVLVWVAFGVGLVVTSFRGWFRDRDLSLDRAQRTAYDALHVRPALKVPLLSSP